MEKRQIPLTCGIPGTETAITAFCYGPVQGVRKVYVQASLHADELPGSLAAWQLCERLQALELQERIRAQIVVVPLCNPLGLRQKLLGAAGYLAAADPVVRLSHDVPVPDVDAALPSRPMDPEALVALSDRYDLDAPIGRLLAALRR